MALMTGVASHLHLDCLVLLVDVHGHLDHLSCGVFVWVVITIRRTADMAEITLDAKRHINLLHHRHQVIGGDVLEYLDILEAMPSGFRFGLGFLRQTNTDQKG